MEEMRCAMNSPEIKGLLEKVRAPVSRDVYRKQSEVDKINFRIPCLQTRTLEKKIEEALKQLKAKEADVAKLKSEVRKHEVRV